MDNAVNHECALAMSELLSLLGYKWFIFYIRNATVVRLFIT
jgi:hypothetical protein